MLIGRLQWIIAAAVLAVLAWSHVAAYRAGGNAVLADQAKAMADMKSEFEQRLADAVSQQQTERNRQRGIADAQLRESQKRAGEYRALWQRALNRPLPDCTLDDEWVHDIRSALAGGAAGADGAPTAGPVAAGAVQPAAGTQ